MRERVVLWEDDAVLAVDKPYGLSVMGERHDTDLITMAADDGESLQWVNRIDKVTSGVVLLAKTKAAHAELTRRFAKRTVDKSYLAICRPGGFATEATIDLPLLTAGSGRVRVAAERGDIRFDEAAARWHADGDLLPRKNYPSTTECRALWDDGDDVVVLAHPVTGRRHQIRVHLAWVGHTIVGDPLFRPKSAPPAPRCHLHSLALSLDGPNGRIDVRAEPDAGFWDPVAGRLDPRELLQAV
ncbi:tRNA pseudouridine32 synthase/23S rRNA pseudouridine746 synthase/23S rRNA pseudouridine1911/1915/1917 synthase [Pseudonocardia endophytica]|uniref:RNA pseudouridylate synthase n=2 Tax=Pseudonocardia endophytica TaxID=401976 RepID=A0A4R1HVA6_PSEEN|nr:tRNA pseudouridine32 synthase/23S rRNA pseudouridine746 synthase/23S rRNA pseudouridine1911/1915/1917 synthase [Pseudonocardia endophytica]